MNYLNRAVRETTGKTTTAHIAKRVTAEARTLLKHTDWPIARAVLHRGLAPDGKLTRLHTATGALVSHQLMLFGPSRVSSITGQ